MALVVPYHGLFLHRTTLDDVFNSKRHTISTGDGVDVSLAEEEAVDGRGFACGGVVEFAVGIGGKGGEELWFFYFILFFQL